MTPTNHSTNTTAAPSAKDQDKKELQSQLDFLLENLRQSEARNEALLSERDKKDALLAEKDAQLSSVALANNNTASIHPKNHFDVSVRNVEEVRVIRRIDRRGGAGWDHLSLNALEAQGETPVAGEDHGHGSRTPWYNPPIQRQRWCEDQSLPHVNWGDIFFDLFYVGAAFNL